MSEIQSVLNNIDDNLDAALGRLFELLKIKSISTDPEFVSDCKSAGEWLVADLKTIGFDAKLHETPGHPMVVAKHDGPKDAPHVLFYGHYDVQPVDPLNLWDEPPFEPSIKEMPDGSKHMTGRGTSDDKGQLMTFVEACRAWKSETGGLPINVTLFFEGEEESGSPSLIPFLEANKDMLKADFALVCDTGMWDRETPAICTGLRGLVGEQLTVQAASRDLHSGMYGSAAANPIRVLSKILSGLHDDEGRCTVPGFYEGVPETPENIIEMWNGLGFSESEFLGDVGLSVPAGEKGRSVLEQVWSRPTCEFNGIEGGYTGEGFKTVIPAIAHAKVSFRLVGTQDPDAIRASFRKYVEECLPADCSVTFDPHGGSPAVHLGYDMPEMKKAATALTQEWEKETALTAMGGSIPVVGHFQNILEMDSLLIGFAQDDDRIHSPNEKYELKSFHKGARSWARIMQALAS
jgi:acetylornithine deacetylase/succinyl-diaminopimelate desuccinylase-like protein